MIAIIGLLSSIVVVSVSTVRAKARDSKRLTDLTAMAKTISLVDNGFASVPLVGCAGEMVDVKTCTTPDLSLFSDPYNPAVLCGESSTASCQYVIAKSNGASGAATQDYEICAFLETNSGPASSAGMVRITNEGQIEAGCI